MSVAVTRRLLVSGHVQGVGYRWWTERAAQALGLAGWVRNLRDGRVEIVATGSAEALDALAERCRTGPEAARVASVEQHDIAYERFAGFAGRPTV